MRNSEVKKTRSATEKEYIANKIRQHWEGYTKSKNKFFYNDRETIQKIRSYMYNTIDTLRYKHILYPEELANSDDTQSRINFTPLDIYSKYRRIAIEIILQMKEDIKIEIADAQAVDEKQNFFGDILAKLYLRDELLKQGVSPELVGLPNDLPEDQQELEMFMEFSYKHIAAIEFETVLNLIKRRNDYDEVIYRKLVEDLHDLGVCVSRDAEEEDGNILLEYVDPEFFFCSSDIENLEYAGEMMKMSPAELMRLTDNESDKNQLKDIEEVILGFAPRNRYYDTIREKLRSQEDMESGLLNVVYCEFADGKSESYEVRTTKDGVKIFGRKSGGNTNKEFMDVEYDCVYEGYWVLGTDIFVGCKKKDFVLRDPDDVKKARLTYHVNAPEKRLNSIGRQVIPSIDGINIAWFKLQNAIQKARPSGIAYDLTSLEAVPLGDGGMSPTENISTYNQTGSIAFRTVDENGDRQTFPLMQLAGGLGSEGRDFMEQIKFNEDMFRSLTGLNELVDGSSPNPRTLKAVAQQAQISSNNALKFIHNSAQRNELSISEAIINRIQDQAETDEIEVYGSALGKNSINFFKITKDHSMRQLGLSFEPKPTAAEESEYNQMLGIAMSTPEGASGAQITLAQKAQLDQVTNTKHKTILLTYFVEKNMEKAEQKKLAMMEKQGQLNQQSAIVAEQAKQQTIQLEHQSKMAQIDREWQWRLREQQIQSQGKIIEQNIGAEARDRESMRMNESKIGVEQMKLSESQKEEENEPEEQDEMQ